MQSMLDSQPAPGVLYNWGIPSTWMYCFKVFLLLPLLQTEFGDSSWITGSH